MLALVSPELIRATCDHLSDVNQGGAFVFEERRVWCRVLDQSEQMQCEVGGTLGCALASACLVSPFNPASYAARLLEQP
jgi:hypothetical protein